MKTFISTLQNSSRSNKVISLVFAASVALVGYSIIATMAASGASFSTIPADGNYDPDQNVTIEVRANTGGEAVNAVQADFSYDDSRLMYQSVDATGSAFSIAADASGGNGSVSIARGNITNVNGNDLLVAKVNFKVLKNGGKAEIRFLSSSAIVRSSDSSNILKTTSGSLFTVSGPAASNSASSGGNSASNPDGSTASGENQNSNGQNEFNTTNQNQAENLNQSSGTNNTNGSLLYAGLIGLAISLLGGAVLYLKKRGKFQLKPGKKDQPVANPDSESLKPSTSQIVSPSDWQDPDKNDKN